MSKRRTITATLIVLGAIILDYFTKNLIHKNLSIYEIRPVINGFFNVVYAKNYGAAFSFLNGTPDWFRKPFFFIVPIVAMVIVLILMKKIIKSTKPVSLKLWAFSLIMGGALGNLISRLQYGYVIDFLDFKITSTYHWPSFNAADTAITIAIFLLITDMILEEEKKPEKK